jgi:hypothetical protein
VLVLLLVSDPWLRILSLVIMLVLKYLSFPLKLSNTIYLTVTTVDQWLLPAMQLLPTIRRTPLREGTSFRLHCRWQLPTILYRQSCTHCPHSQGLQPRGHCARSLRRYHSLQGIKGVRSTTWPNRRNCWCWRWTRIIGLPIRQGYGSRYHCYRWR